MAVRRVFSLGTGNEPIPIRPRRSAEVQRSDELRQVGAHVASRPSIVYWFLMFGDLATALWMLTVGSWLDETSRFTATATLGGHHIILLITALIGFLMLATLAVLTDNFTRTTPKQAFARNLACIVSVVALTGLLALVLITLLIRLLFGRLRP